MKIDEIKLGILARGRLKRVCARIYNRLVVEDPEFQANTDEIQNLMIISGYFGLLLILIKVVLAAAIGLVDGATESTSLHWISANVWPISIVATFMLFLFTFRNISRAAFEISGAGFISSAKAGQNQDRLMRMLDIVEGWLRTKPTKVCDAHQFLFRKSAAQLLPANVSIALRRLQQIDSADALVIRNFGEKRYWWLYIGSYFSGLVIDKEKPVRNYWREARGLRNAIKVNLAFDVLHAELRDEVPSGEFWRRDYSTRDSRQYTSLFDPFDLHLRFKTGAPYYRWPQPGRASSEKETGTYRLIMCLENPMRCPIDVISVDEIIGKFEEAVSTLYPELRSDGVENANERKHRVESAIRLLQQKDVHMYGQRQRQTLRPTADAGTDPEPVLMNLNAGKLDPEGVALSPRWALRWDPNVIDWSKTTDPDGSLFRAMAILVQAVDLAGDSATKVQLGRGDVLIIDNVRCLICRREWFGDNVFGDSAWGKLTGWLKTLLFFPDRWWLRGFYGYRKGQMASKLPGS